MLPAGHFAQNQTNDIQQGAFTDYVQLCFGMRCEILAQGLWAESCVLDLREPTTESISEPAPVVFGPSRGFATVSHMTAQGLTAANIPTKLSSAAVSDAVSQTTSAAASAIRP